MKGDLEQDCRFMLPDPQPGGPDELDSMEFTWLHVLHGAYLYSNSSLEKCTCNKQLKTHSMFLGPCQRVADEPFGGRTLLIFSEQAVQ